MSTPLTFIGGVRAEARSLVEVARVDLAAVILIVGVVIVYSLRAVVGDVSHSYSDRLLMLYFLLSAFGLYWPVAVWRGDAPRRREYLRARPVRTPGPEAARVVAGYAILVLLSLLCIGVGASVGYVIGRGAELSSISPLAWLAAALGITITYALGSVIALGRETPGRWIILLFVVPHALRLILRDEQGNPTFDPLSLLAGRIGLETATWRPIAMASIDNPMTDYPPEQWLPAALVWLTIGLLLVAYQLRRRPPL